MSRATRSRNPFAVLSDNQVGHGTDDDISLEVYPPSQIVFTGTPEDNQCYGEFDLINSSSHARFAFKVKSTAQKGVIRVTPVSGVVEPRQTVKVAVTMLHSTIGYTARGAATATNNWLGHRILVQSMEVPKNCADLDTIWSTTPWRLIKATKLDCVFLLTQRRSTLTARTGAVPRRINSRATTVTGGMLVGSGAAMTGVIQRRRRKNVTGASQTKTGNNPWAPTVNTANQNDWEIAEDKENAGDENAWGTQNAWAEDGGNSNGNEDNVADDWGTDNNAATEDAWGTDQNNGATAPAADDWENTQNNNDDDWGANDGGGGVQVNDDAWGFDNNAATAVADDGWAVNNPATVTEGAAAAATAWNNENYSATAGAAAAGDYGGQGMNMTFNHGRVIVAFKGIQDIVFVILVVLFIGLIIGKIF